MAGQGRWQVRVGVSDADDPRADNGGAVVRASAEAKVTSIDTIDEPDELGAATADATDDAGTDTPDVAPITSHRLRRRGDANFDNA